MKFSTDKKGYKISEVDAFIKKITQENNSVVEAQRARIDALRHALDEAESKINSYKDKSGQITKAIMSAVAKADDIEKLSGLKYSQELARLRVFHEKWVAHYYRILEKYPIDEDLLTAGEFNQRVRKVLARQTSDFEQTADAARVSSALEEIFESEKKRLEEKQIGYITIQTKKKKNSNNDKDDILDLLPDCDLSSPIISGDPLERIKKFLSGVKAKEVKSIKAKNNTKTSNVGYDTGTAATVNSGFSFEEALNPKDDLGTIMKDLGLVLD